MKSLNITTVYGDYIDESLSFEEHIDICCKANQTLHANAQSQESESSS